MAWRISITVDPETKNDFVYGLGNIGLVTHLEVWIGISVACMPTLAPLYSKYLAPMFSRKTHTSQKGMKEAKSTVRRSKKRGFWTRNFSRLDDDTTLELEEGHLTGGTESVIYSLGPTESADDNNPQRSIGVTHDIELLEGADLQSPDCSERKAVHDGLSRRLHEGSVSFAYYGQSMEKPGTAFTFVGLDAPDTHGHVSGSRTEADSTADPQSILRAGKAAAVIRVPFGPTPDPSPALGNHARAGVSELVFFHFPTDLPNKDEIMRSIDKMRPVVARSEALAVFDGWAMEDTADENGEKSRFYVNLVGWVDVDAHMRFQSTDDFKQNVHHLLDIPELRQLEMHHVKVYAV
ncbi:MAG: hypothetical protein Q9193_005804 [Seirophora villosa]